MKNLLLTLTAAILCSGCIVTSLNPFYTKDTIVAVPELQGSWELGKFDDEEYRPLQVKLWEISDSEILTFDNKGLGGPLSYKTFKVGDETFIDVVPESNSSLDASGFWTKSVWPMHSLLKLTITGDQIILTPLNYEWFEAKTKSGAIALPMVKAQGEEWGFYTATSQEWQAFLLKYKDQEIFREQSQIILTRKKPLFL